MDIAWRKVRRARVADLSVMRLWKAIRTLIISNGYVKVTAVIPEKTCKAAPDDFACRAAYLQAIQSQNVVDWSHSTCLVSESLKDHNVRSRDHQQTNSLTNRHGHKP